MNYIDTHAHLTDEAFSEELDEVILKMKTSGVSACVCVACDDDDRLALETLLDRFPGYLFGAWALHPEYDDKREPTREEIARINADPRFVAVGETGLDYYWCKDKPLWQRDRFVRHIEAAFEINKPLIIHARDAEKEALDILKAHQAGDLGFVMHCYSSDIETAKACLAAGGMISLTGAVTFKRNDALREVARAVPLGSLMLETDCPFMAPVPYRGKRADPSMCLEVAQTIALVKGLTLNEVLETTTANAIRFFNLPLSN